MDDADHHDALDEQSGDHGCAVRGRLLHLVLHYY
jgi:hypothetical protein